MRQRLRSLSNVIGLEGYATTPPPRHQPFADNDTGDERNPLDVNDLGKEKWDRFQTMSGIQFYFDTEFQLLFGHVYYADSEWALSSINQTGLWAEKPTVAEHGYASIMSVDIGDWRNPSSHINKSAYECPPDELAQEVWRQVSTELAESVGEQSAGRHPPIPSYYSIDHFIHYPNDDEPPTATRRPTSSRSSATGRTGPVPRRGTRARIRRRGSREETRRQQAALGVWQAGHGGYLVHFDKLVFAGTWCKTFTRMTSMESACESARHAVNAILDHYLYTTSGQRDRRSRHRCRGRCRTGLSTRTSPTRSGSRRRPATTATSPMREPRARRRAADTPARRRVLRPGPPASVGDVRHGPGRGRRVRAPIRSTTSPTTCRRSSSSCGSGGASSRRCSRPHRRLRVRRDRSPARRDRPGTSGCTASRRPPRRCRRVYRRGSRPRATGWADRRGPAGWRPGSGQTRLRPDTRYD